MNGVKFRRFLKMEPAKRVLSKFLLNSTTGSKVCFNRASPSNGNGQITRWSYFSKHLRHGGNVAHNLRSFNYFPQPNFQNSPSLNWCHLIIRNFRRVRASKDSIKTTKSKQEEIIDKLPPLPPRYSMSDCYNLIVKPLAFTACVGASSVVGCTIWQYEDYRRGLSQDRRFSIGNFRLPLPGTATPPQRQQSGPLRQRFDSWWSTLSNGEKLFWPICAINTVVWAAWRVPGLAPVMVKYFTATPVSRAICWPMLFSTFSHYSFMHLFANMFVLHSFIPAAVSIMGKENFMAMYVTSGVVASYGSHLHKLFTGVNIPSLGASGAIMGILGLVCTRMPDIKLGIIFIPNLQFTADTALKCILAVDVAGIIARWKFMDHAAHLSGCLFGIAFSHYGTRPLSALRDSIMSSWHKLRTSGLSDR